MLLTPLALLPLAQTWTVDDDGPADFADLPAAVAAASPGDTLLVAPGSYGGVVLDKSLQVVGNGAGTVWIDALVVRDTPSASRVLLSGLHLTSADASGLLVERAGGVVWVESCFVQTAAVSSFLVLGIQTPATLFGAAQVVESDNVYIHASTLRGTDSPPPAIDGTGQPGLLAKDSRITLFDSLCQGGTPGIQMCGDGGDGALLLGSQLLASGTTFAGGGGTPPWEEFEFGVFCPGGDGGHALHLIPGALGFGPSEVRGSSVTLLAGQSGGSLPGFFDTDPGLELVDTAGSLVAFDDQPLRQVGGAPVFMAPGSTSLQLQGAPGDQVLLLASVDPLATWLLPLGGPQLVNSPWVVLAAGSLDAVGQGQLPIALGVRPSEPFTWYLQTAHVSIDGGVVAGGGQSVTVLGR